MLRLQGLGLLVEQMCLDQLCAFEHEGEDEDEDEGNEHQFEMARPKIDGRS